jgi:hypothetical protein
VRRDMTVGDAITALKKEIQDRAKTLSVLEQMVANQGPEEEPGSHPRQDDAPRARRRSSPGSVGSNAVEILQAAGRPMHGLRELLPALQARGLKPSKASLPTTLMRQKSRIRRTAPGTWAYTGGEKHK